MATITISGLPEISTILDYTNIPVETVGITQRITGANLKAYLAALPALTATSGNIAGALTAGSLTVNGAGTINGALQATGITATTGNITNLTVGNLAVTGTSSFNGNVNATNFNATATVHAVSLYGAIATPAQPAITSVGTLSGLTVTNTINGNVSGSAATVTSAAQPNITSVGALTGVTVNGTATVNTLNANVISVASFGTLAAPITSIYATTINATNYTVSGTFLPTTNGSIDFGSNVKYFGTIYGQATTAKYADLAELYIADADYENGTVLIFGTEAEVTESTVANDTRVAGVVSTNPAHLMNGGLEAEFVAKVALQGRVPCKVVGSIKRGDMLTTSDIPGVATVATNPVLGSIIGKALENYSSAAVGVIEVVVGRL